MPRLLFPGGVHCSVSEGTTLSFPPREESDTYYYYWAFTVEGVVFELRRAFMTAALEPSALDVFVESAPRMRSAELFPIVLDFLVRRYKDSKACLRTSALTRAQTRALDAVEASLFPSLVPDRVYADEARTRVLVALLPCYRETFFGTFAVHERAHGDANADAFLHHEGLEGLCMDARFVRLVQASKVGDPTIARQLELKFGLSKPITDALLDACELIAVDRGMPFCIETCEGSGESWQCVAEEPQAWHVA